MTRQGRGVVLLAGSPPKARAWVRGGVVPCHVVAHGAWTIVAPATGRTAARAPYDDPARILSSRHVGSRMAPALGFFVEDSAAWVTARGPGRSRTRWALRDPDHVVMGGDGLPPLAPEHLHRVLGHAAGAGSRPVPLRALHEVWARTDLPHLDWLLELLDVLGLPGGRLLEGSDPEPGPTIGPGPRTVAAFETAVKDAHQ